MSNESQPKLEPMSPSDLRGDVLHALRRAIMSGRLRPGERLKLTVLADQMQVSTGPVREALSALEREGLVVFTPNHSPCVATFSGADFRDIMESRWLVERHCFRRAAQRVTPESLARLTQLVGQMEQGLAQQDEEQSVGPDLEFHREVVRLAGNRQLLEFWSQLANYVRVFLGLVIEGGYNANDMSGLHRDILQALQSGDLETVMERLNQHIEQVNLEMEEMIRRAEAAQAQGKAD
jgi:DNA-binding GntR family transcriptional regulator